MTHNNPLSPGTPSSDAQGSAQPLSLGVSAGLLVGAVVFAVTSDARWIGIGLAFGPAAAVSIGAALRRARET